MGIVHKYDMHEMRHIFYLEYFRYGEAQDEYQDVSTTTVTEVQEETTTETQFEGTHTVTEPNDGSENVTIFATETVTEGLQLQLSLQSGFLMGTISLLILALRNYYRRR